MRPKICGSVGNGRKTYAFGRMGCKILKVYRDNGLSGAKGDKRRGIRRSWPRRSAAQVFGLGLWQGRSYGGAARKGDWTAPVSTGQVA
jgi:hypothetical protein